MGISLQSRAIVVCLAIAMTVASPGAYRGDEPAAFPGDKINLALRRTADKLLRAAVESASRIPAVRQVDGSTWQIEVSRPVQTAMQ